MPARSSLLRSIVAIPRLAGLAFVLAIGLTVVAGVSLVAAQRGEPGEPPSGPAAYHGCVNTYTGVLRIIADGQSCQDHETAIELGASGGDAALVGRIEALEETNTSQQTLIETQQGEIDLLDEENGAQEQAILTLQGDLDDLFAAHTALQAQVPDCLSTEGTEVYFTECNVNIRSGAGETDAAVNGLGNLIIGYNEREDDDERTGSHNLVVGPTHSYTSYGGLVAGSDNTIEDVFSSVTGGRRNTASGANSSVTGGSFNTASNAHSSVTGGFLNTASGVHSSVTGGQANRAIGEVSNVNGGSSNTANADQSSVTGGFGNTATGIHSSLTGGHSNTAGGDYSSVNGGQTNIASADFSSVGGGIGLIADDTHEFLPFTP